MVCLRRSLMLVSRNVEINDVTSFLRCGARDKWIEATDDQKEIVWQLITDVLACNGKIPTESEINDFIWFNCDEIFFPEECDTE